MYISTWLVLWKIVQKLYGVHWLEWLIVAKVELCAAFHILYFGNHDQERTELLIEVLCSPIIFELCCSVEVDSINIICHQTSTWLCLIVFYANFKCMGANVCISFYLVGRSSLHAFFISVLVVTYQKAIIIVFRNCWFILNPFAGTSGIHN